MAPDTERTHIWDSNNGGQQELVLFSKYRYLLNDKRPELMTEVNPDPMWPYLRALRAISASNENDIKLNGSSPTSQMESLLDHLERGPVWRLHVFLRACVLANQAHIVSLVGLKPDDYRLPEDPPVESSRQNLSNATSASSRQSLLCRITVVVILLTLAIVSGMFIQSATYPYQRPHLKLAIEMHRNNYDSRIMTGVVFDIDDDPDVEVLDLGKTYIETDLEMNDENGQKTKVLMKDLFKTFDGEYNINTIKVSGQAGTGKTTYLKHLAKSWSQSKLDWKIVIYVPAISMTADIWGSIRSNLLCEESRKDSITNYLREDGAGSLIMFDALDEIHDGKTIKNLQSFIDEQNNRKGPKVLVVARPELSQQKSKSFQRSLDLPGFSIKQGLDYVSLHHHAMSTEQGYEILEYVNRNQVRLAPILSNPLLIHIFCVLTSKGHLNLSSHHHFNRSMLFGSLEQFMVMREYAKHGSKQPSSSEISVHARAFYRLCLYGLVEKQLVLTDKLMDLFGVENNSPYYVFLEKITIRDIYARKRVLYSFIHSAIYNYFAACGLLRASSDLHMPTLLLLASEPPPMDFHLIALEMAAEVSIDIAVDFVKAWATLNVILDKREGSGPDIYDHLIDCYSEEDVQEFFQGTPGTLSQVQQISKIWSFINSKIFNKISDMHITYEEGIVIVMFVRSALRDHSIHTLNMIHKATINHVLPAGRKMGQILYSVSSTELVMVVDEDKSIQLFARCPKHAYLGLQQHMERYNNEPGKQQLGIALMVSWSVTKSVPLPFPGLCPEDSMRKSDWQQAVSKILKILGTKSIIKVATSKNTPVTEILNAVYPLFEKPISEHECLERMRVANHIFTYITISGGTIRLRDILNWMVKSESLLHFEWQLNETSIIMPEVLSIDLVLKTIRILLQKNILGQNVIENPRWTTESGEEYTWNSSEIKILRTESTFTVSTSANTPINRILDAVGPQLIKQMTMREFIEVALNSTFFTINGGKIRLRDTLIWMILSESFLYLEWQLNDTNMIMPEVMSVELAQRTSHLLQKKNILGQNVINNAKWITESGEEYIWNNSEIMNGECQVLSSVFTLIVIASILFCCRRGHHHYLM